ncbi:TPA: pantetheine-phosphate adenylyltransferase [Candidatus Bathyarchaeota archaeon]|nr:pantetheine-phosphate adenylyltransferase [Candidatus Bathyarchaeota archaeon]
MKEGKEVPPIVRRFKRLGLGGTFDLLHRGHEYVLRLAFQLAEKVVLGLSTDELASEIKGRKVTPFPERKSRLKAFLEGEGLVSRAEIVSIDGRLGTATEDPEMDAVLISHENRSQAAMINEERSRKGLKPLKIVFFEKVLAEDGKPISAARIRAGEINREGGVR